MSAPAASLLPGETQCDTDCPPPGLAKPDRRDGADAQTDAPLLPPGSPLGAGDGFLGDFAPAPDRGAGRLPWEDPAPDAPGPR